MKSPETPKDEKELLSNFLNDPQFEQIRNVAREDARVRFGEINPQNLRESMAYRYKDIPIAFLTDEIIAKHFMEEGEEGE